MKQYFRSEKLKTLFLALIFLPCLFLMSACGGSVDFKINFVVDGVVYATIKTSGNETIYMPDVPTKEGYVFDGWYLDKDIWNEPFTANSLLNTPLKKDMSVYAKFVGGEGFKLSKQNNGDIILLSYSGGANSVTIPSEITSIGSSAFSDCTSLETVTFAENSKCESIGSCAFYNCTSLTSITIPVSVTSIGNYAFYGCTGLGTVTFEENSKCESIGYEAFYNCTSLTSITISESVTSIGSSAFGGCSSLTSITIPASVTSVESYVFYDCAGLESVTFAENSKCESIGSYAFYNCTSLTNTTIPKSVTSIEYRAFYNCTSLTGVYITDLDKWASIDFDNEYSNPLYYAENLYLNGTLVTDATLISATGISSYAFNNCTSLTSIIIPESVTSIGSYAFSGCARLGTVTFAENGKCESIGYSAFYNCTSLTGIAIPKNVTSIGYGTFNGCSSLVEMTLPFVGSSASATNATSLTLFGYIFGTSSYTGGTSTKQYYSSSSYTTYYIPSSLRKVTILGANMLYGAFYDCSMLTEITIPGSVASIDRSGFSGCTSLKTVILAENSKCVSIGYEAFYNCASLTNITIPESVTSIGYYAFYNCKSLTSITIPESVTSIGYFAFGGCSSLVEMTLPFVGSSGSATSASSSTLFGYIFGTRSYTGGTGTRQYCASGSYTTYYIPSSLKKVTILGGNILYGAFYGCSMLTEITIPENMTSIGGSAFRECISLTSITIPESVTGIGNYTFHNCSGLETINYNAINCTDLSSANYVFCRTGQDGNGITLNIGSNVEKIPARLFYSNSSSDIPKLTSVVFAENNKCKSIGEYVFYNCKSLTSITIPESVTSIGNQVFYNCTSLIGVYITNLDKWAIIDFGDVSSNPLCYAKNLYLNGDLVTDSTLSNATEISAYAFYNCTSLTNITIPESVTSIESEAFCNCTSLTSITLPTSVTSIGGSAFRRCLSLTSITIPESVISIGDDAFYNCTSLTGVYITDLDKWVNINFSDKYSNPLCYANNLYLNGELVTEVTLISATKISSFAFDGCTSLTSITIPESVTSIGSYSFYNCTSLTRVYYEGGESDWNKIIGTNNSGLTDATKYYYSEEEPTDDGNYWHYDDDNNVVIWGKDY